MEGEGCKAVKPSSLVLKSKNETGGLSRPTPYFSGNPDDFDFVFKFQSTTKKDNRLTFCCPKPHRNSTYKVKNRPRITCGAYQQYGRI